MNITEISTETLRKILKKTRRAFGSNSQSAKILERELERRERSGGDEAPANGEGGGGKDGDDDPGQET